jgi:hypothetical protein
MLILNLTNATMWFFYGLFAKNDINIYGPNGIGAILAILQCSLCIIFPNREERQKGKSLSEIILLLQGKLPPSPSAEHDSLTERFQQP